MLPQPRCPILATGENETGFGWAKRAPSESANELPPTEDSACAGGLKSNQRDRPQTTWRLRFQGKVIVILAVRGGSLMTLT
jgi:hypothetical protein